MQLVPDWRSAWKWFSMWCFALLTALPMVWANLPPDVKAYIPAKYGIWIVIALAASGAIGRVIDQKPKDASA